MADKTWGYNLAEKYADKVAERFKLQSLATGFTNREYNWTGVKTLWVYSIQTVALQNYGRHGALFGNSGASRYGTLTDLQDEAQELTVSQDKSFTFVIDKGDKMDSMNVRDAGKALRREIDEVIVPTEDRYVFHKLAKGAYSAGNYAYGSFANANAAYAAFLAGQTALDNKYVPAGGRIAAVNATTLALLKQSDAFVKSSEIGQKMLINGQVGEIDGVKIVKVPDNYLPSNCHFIITHPSVTVKAEKLADYKIHQDPPFISGNLVEGRVYYDAFILNAKKDGVYAHLSANSEPSLPDTNPTPVPSA
jgi:hypothetical protein